MGVGIRKPYLRVVGIQVDTEGPGRSSGAPLNPLEEEEFNRFASRPDAFETLAKSIAPFIYGSEDIKKAIACLLFGGSRKRCEKRSDINCLGLLEYVIIHNESHNDSLFQHQPGMLLLSCIALYLNLVQGFCSSHFCYYKFAGFLMGSLVVVTSMCYC